MNDDASSGFLQRWSRRKAEVREGVPQVEATPQTEPPVPVAAPSVCAFSSTKSRLSCVQATSSGSPASLVALAAR